MKMRVAFLCSSCNWSRYFERIHLFKPENRPVGTNIIGQGTSMAFFKCRRRDLLDGCMQKTMHTQWDATGANGATRESAQSVANGMNAFGEK
jgi:hypothetical protein